MRFCSVEGCKYPNFSQDKITGEPFCRNHQTRRTDFDRRTILNRAMDKQNSINNQIRSLANTDANLESVVKTIIKGELQEYFEYHLANSPMRCENCNKSLKHYNRLDFFGCQAHILPKALFPSVATELSNHLVLCKWGSCHQDYDSSWLKASTMPVFPLAKERFLLFKDLIDVAEIRKIPDCFLLPS